MNTNVINTQRFADRMKEAGVEDGPAVAMSQALNSELANVATKDDLTKFATKDDLANLAANLATKEDLLATKEGLLGIREDLAKLNGRVDVLEAKYDAKFVAMEDKISTNSRYVYLVSALLVALGLYDVVAPHFPPRETPSVAVESTQTTAEAPDAADPADDDRPPTQATANSPR